MIFGKKNLIIAAHPDDEVLGVGGTIPLILRDGGNVDVLIVTDGSTSQYDNSESFLKKKRVETTNALLRLGVNEFTQWSFPDMKLDTISHVKLNKELEKFIRSNEYDTVFCQDCGDINMDHRILYQSVEVAVRPYPSQTVKRFLTYYVNSSSEWGGILSSSSFSPNVFVNIEDTIDLKLSSMLEYKTELRDYPHPRSIESMKNSASYFGNMVGYLFAEPFRLIFSR